MRNNRTFPDQYFIRRHRVDVDDRPCHPRRTGHAGGSHRNSHPPFATSVQDIPINITALGSDLIQRERLSDLSDIARRVPGMTVVDQGPRSGNILTVRGLNVDSLNCRHENVLGNGGGDNVGHLCRRNPRLYVDLKLNDMERVEVLIGPQGTLYGSPALWAVQCAIYPTNRAGG